MTAGVPVRARCASRVCSAASFERPYGLSCVGLGRRRQHDQRPPAAEVGRRRLGHGGQERVQGADVAGLELGLVLGAVDAGQVEHDAGAADASEPCVRRGIDVDLGDLDARARRKATTRFLPMKPLAPVTRPSTLASSLQSGPAGSLPLYVDLLAGEGALDDVERKQHFRHLVDRQPSACCGCCSRPSRTRRSGRCRSTGRS